MNYNVVCVKWGTKYDADYVNRLYNMVKKNLSLPYKFICLTDDSKGLNKDIDALPFTRKDLVFWWTKLNIFELNLHAISGQAIFFDLDVVITDNIDCLFTFNPDKEFIGVLDWSRLDQINSSVMRYDISKSNYIIDNFYKMFKHNELRESNEWDSFMKINKIVYWERDTDRFYEGDQKWISRQLENQNLQDHYFPKDWILSYKRHGTKDLPENCKVMVFHGEPKPDQVDHEYVKNLWR
jgi:hypothetical protein